jgi:hypothetical protein
MIIIKHRAKYVTAMIVAAACFFANEINAQTPLHKCLSLTGDDGLYCAALADRNEQWCYRMLSEDNKMDCLATMRKQAMLCRRIENSNLRSKCINEILP